MGIIGLVAATMAAATVWLLLTDPVTVADSVTKLSQGDVGPAMPRAIDLLIVDEAHHCAPPGRGKYAVDSQQTRAVSRLSAHSENRLFLTATPHNGYAESWTALLAMVRRQPELNP